MSLTNHPLKIFSSTTAHMNFTWQGGPTRLTLLSRLWSMSLQELPSNTAPGTRCRVLATAPIVEVKTTRFKPFALAHDSSTLTVPFMAGSRSCVCRKSVENSILGTTQSFPWEDSFQNVNCNDLVIRITREAQPFIIRNTKDWNWPEDQHLPDRMEWQATLYGKHRHNLVPLNRRNPNLLPDSSMFDSDSLDSLLPWCSTSFSPSPSFVFVEPTRMIFRDGLGSSDSSKPMSVFYLTPSSRPWRLGVQFRESRLLLRSVGFNAVLRWSRPFWGGFPLPKVVTTRHHLLLWSAPLRTTEKSSLSTSFIWKPRCWSSQQYQLPVNCWAIVGLKENTCFTLSGNNHTLS